MIRAWVYFSLVMVITSAEPGVLVFGPNNPNIRCTAYENMPELCHSLPTFRCEASHCTSTWECSYDQPLSHTIEAFVEEDHKTLQVHVYPQYGTVFIYILMVVAFMMGSCVIEVI